MVKIEFEPYDGEDLTSEEYDRIVDFISQFGGNINIDEE